MTEPSPKEIHGPDHAELSALKRQYERARLNAVRAQMAELEMEYRTKEVIDGALYLLQKPLNVVKAMSDNLKRRLHEGEADKQMPMGVALDEALSSGNRAMSTLRLSLPGENNTVHGPVNVCEAIRDCLVISADRLSSSGIVVDWRPEPDLPMVFGEETALRILLRTLLDNALMAVGQSGARGREVRIETLSGQDGLIEVCFHDSGPGIHRDLRTRIFEPFFSAWEGELSRAGMGLAIARQIVFELRGEIEVRENPRSGCAICISLPASQSRPVNLK